MTTSLRIRYFGWLALLLLIFIVVQALVYGLVEIATIASTPGLSVHDQMMEVMVGVGMDFLLFPILLIPAWWISRRMLRSIHAISKTARHISHGNFDERINPELMPDEETRALAACINTAFDKYREAAARLDRFIGDAAHQLRTPLAGLRTTVEVAMSKARTPDEYRDCLSDVLQSTGKLSRLVEQMLQLARLRGNELAQHFKQVDLNLLIERVCDLYRPLCDDRKIQLACETSSTQCVIAGNEDLLQELLANLMENAARYTPENGQIVMSARRVENKVEITVSDNGPGITKDEAAHIFARFRRGSAADNTGTGLGLALVSEIARAHSGHVALARKEEPGAVFVVQLPAIAANTP